VKPVYKVTNRSVVNQLVKYLFDNKKIPYPGIELPFIQPNPSYGRTDTIVGVGSAKRSGYLYKHVAVVSNSTTEQIELLNIDDNGYLHFVPSSSGTDVLDILVKEGVFGIGNYVVYSIQGNFVSGGRRRKTRRSRKH
jgi:hypothetical protein